MKFRFGSITPWMGAAIVVVAGGYYFLKIRPKQQAEQMAPVMNAAPPNVVNQAIENIGSKRVRAYAASRNSRRRRLPKVKKARSV
jgi:hypothetical protein